MRELPCNRSDVGPDDPDLDPWFDPKFYPYVAPVCARCPFLQWCATEALALRDNGYQILGMWATVDFTEDDQAARYRRRIQRLEKIAATGLVPRSRRSRIDKSDAALADTLARTDTDTEELPHAADSSERNTSTGEGRGSDRISPRDQLRLFDPVGIPA
jgi:hypothetical protein